MVLPEDPIYREMFPEFIASWKHETDVRLLDIIKSSDTSELYRFGHTLIGSGRQFGVESFAQIGKKIEECSRTNNWSAMSEIRSQLLAEIRLVESEFGSL